MLDGKRVLITGANGGIGSSISEILLKNNAKLILLYHKNRNNIDKLIENFPDHKLEVFQLDLLDDTKLNYKRKNIQNFMKWLNDNALSLDNDTPISGATGMYIFSKK